MDLIIDNKSYQLLDNPIIQIVNRIHDPHLPSQFKEVEESFEVNSSKLNSDAHPYDYFRSDMYFGKLIVEIDTKYTEEIKSIYEYCHSPHICRTWTLPIKIVSHKWELNFDCTRLLECIDCDCRISKLIFKYDYYSFRKLD